MFRKIRLIFLAILGGIEYLFKRNGLKDVLHFINEAADDPSTIDDNYEWYLWNQVHTLVEAAEDPELKEETILILKVAINTIADEYGVQLKKGGTLKKLVLRFFALIFYPIMTSKERRSKR